MGEHPDARAREIRSGTVWAASGLGSSPTPSGVRVVIDSSFAAVPFVVDYSRLYDAAGDVASAIEIDWAADAASWADESLKIAHETFPAVAECWPG